jgi:hypothetical protein
MMSCRYPAALVPLMVTVATCPRASENKDQTCASVVGPTGSDSRRSR